MQYPSACPVWLFRRVLAFLPNRLTKDRPTAVCNQYVVLAHLPHRQGRFGGSRSLFLHKSAGLCAGYLVGYGSQ